MIVIALQNETPDADPQQLQAEIQNALDQAFGAGIAIAQLSSSSANTGTMLHRRSMVVLVDQRRAPRLDDVNAVASAAGGFDFRRGDRVDIEVVHFREAGPRRKALLLALAGSAITVAPTAIICVAVLLGLRIGIRPAVGIFKTMIRTANVMRAQRTVTDFAPTQVRGMLRGEPPHTAAAIISALPAATAAAVLDLYPPEERGAIIRRMSRERSPLIPDVESFISHA